MTVQLSCCSTFCAHSRHMVFATCKAECRGCEADSRSQRKPAAVAPKPPLRADRVRPRIEIAVRAMVAGDRFPKIVRPLRVLAPVVLLRVISRARQVMVGE